MEKRILRSQTSIKEKDKFTELILENLYTIEEDYALHFKENIWSDDLSKRVGILQLISTRKITAEIIENATAIFCISATYNADIMKRTINKYIENTYGDMIFWVQKYDKYLNFTQLCKFSLEHKSEKFIILREDNENTKMFALVNSQPYKISVNYYTINYLNGKFIKEAYQETEDKTYNWGEMKIFNNPEGRVKKFEQRILHGEYYYRNENEEEKFLLAPPEYSKTELNYSDRYRIINASRSTNLTRENILKVFLRLPGTTRLSTEWDYYGLSIRICKPQLNISNKVKRFGLKSNEDDYCRDESLMDKADIFPNSELSSEDYKRIINYIKQCLIDGKDCTKENVRILRYGEYCCPIFKKSVLAITSPVKGHRRPTYHLIYGFKNGEEIEIIELCKGELQMKEMFPVNTYFLYSETGSYVHVSRKLYSQLKNIILNAEVDKKTAEEWSEDQSQHPLLLKAISQEADEKKFTLPIIKTFNKVPFGSLLLEQLIKLKYSDLAINLARHILKVGDNMHYNIGCLRDILPDSNPEETSLLKILNLNKSCYNILINNMPEFADDFILKYKLIKTFISDGIVTKEKEKLISQYLELKKYNMTNYSLVGGTWVDILKYPEVIKPIYKMRNKIDIFFNRGYKLEALREYNEIVQAYLGFRELEMDPASYMIFLEFSLGDSSNLDMAYNELHSREMAANDGLQIYRDKINEKIRIEKESQYKYRKEHSLKKLCSIKSKDTILGDYVIIAPTQIYGEDVVGSVEKEGLDMNHCVFRSYATQIADGKYTVLYLRKKENPDKSFITIGINSEGRINQTYGINDSSINAEMSYIISEWAKQKKGLVTFKSEHDSVRPGGWTPGAAVPDLEKPSREWLQQLARIK